MMCFFYKPLLDMFWIALSNLTKSLIDCIEEVLCEKKILTVDLGGHSTTSEVGDEIVRKIEKRGK